jgi:hypothetical protein
MDAAIELDKAECAWCGESDCDQSCTTAIIMAQPDPPSTCPHCGGPMAWQITIDGTDEWCCLNGCLPAQERG